MFKEMQDTKLEIPIMLNKTQDTILEIPVNSLFQIKCITHMYILSDTIAKQMTMAT